VFNNSLPVSSLFCKISLLYLPHCFPARIHCTFLFFCLLCFLHHSLSMHLLFSIHFSCCTLLLLHTSIPHKYNNNHPLLSFASLYSLCILCMPYVKWFCMLCMSSALPVHHGNSSASLFVNHMCPSSLGVIIKLLHITSS
jgi:hypothetical protein